jgi:hypothetical protein
MSDSEQAVKARGRALLLLDLCCLTALLVLAALPLLLLRDISSDQALPLVARFAVLALGVCGLWATAARWLRPAAPRVTDTTPGPAATPDRRRWAVAVLAAVLLGALVVVSFYQPLRKQYWAGADEFLFFDEDIATAWSWFWDVTHGRPLTFALIAPVRALFPGRIEGFLFLAPVLIVANGLTLAAILRRALPRPSAVPWLAAALLVLHHADPNRFAVMWATDYYLSALLFFQLALWLFLASAARESRLLLALSCLLLGASLLTSEGLFPLALVGPVLLRLSGQRGRTLAAWSCAWVGTVALVAVRLLLFLMCQEVTYQGRMAAAAPAPAVLWDNFVAKLATLGDYFQLNGPVGHWRSCLAAAACAGALTWLATRADREPRRPRRLLAAGAGVALLACVLGLLPFLHLADPFRTLFFAAPAQAAFLTCGLCLVASLLPRLAARLALAGAVAFVAVVATAEAHRAQDDSGPDRFATVVRLFDQLRAVRYTPDTLVLLIADDGIPFPTGVVGHPNYSLGELSHSLLGTPVLLANCTDPMGHSVTFSPEGVQAGTVLHKYKKRYDEVVAFRLAADATLTLLPRLPAGLLPEGCDAEGYAPFARMVPGPIRPISYLRYTSWAPRPLDLWGPEDGALLGRNWARLEAEDGCLYRWAHQDAEFVVNPLGQDVRQFLLELEPGPRFAGKPCPLEVLDPAGRVVASVTLLGRQEVRLTLPTPRDRVGLFRLCVRDEAPAAGRTFRAFRPGGPVSNCRPLSLGSPNIACDDVRLGKNWQHVEDVRGQLVRVFADAAEVHPSIFAGPGAELVFDVGPAPGSRPCRLQVRDGAGQVVTEAEVRERQEVRAPLSASPRPDTVYRLHVAAGEGDGRASDLRVYGCRCAPRPGACAVETKGP